MAEKKATQIIILHESVAQSWARDASSFALALAMIGVGVWLESSAIQWIGWFVWLVVLTTLASNATKKMTIKEAREFLDEIEGRVY
jgi:hypothetical protein